MTEAEWLACNDPHEMLFFLEHKTSERKMRLFACACCRRIWPRMRAKGCREAVERAERYADLYAERLETREEVADAIYQLLTRRDGGDPYEEARRLADRIKVNPEDLTLDEKGRETSLGRFATLASVVTSEHAWGIALEVSCWLTDEGLLSPEDQCEFLRDIIGNPFVAASIEAATLPTTITSLARTTYEERNLPSGGLDPARLAVLSDALEEAGCTDADILSHLRSPGPHVRGCWPLDLVLGKE